MRIFIMLLITVINLIIQSTVSLYFDNAFMLPNTMIVIVISYAIVRNDIEGAVFGFANGLLIDLAFGRLIGFYALITAIVGYLSAKPFEELNPHNIFIPAIMIFAMSILNNLLIYFFGFLFFNKIKLIEYFVNIIMPESVFNALVGLVIYPILYYINKNLERNEKPDRKMFTSDV